MKKEQIYVTIDTEEKRLRAIEILEKAGEEIYKTSGIWNTNHFNKLLEIYDGYWLMSGNAFKTKQEITLDQLEALLIPNYQVKDVILSLDELKQQAEKLGYDLVEKPYEPKVGDFGYFWDEGDDVMISYGFLTEMDKSISPYKANEYNWWMNFRKLTDEEKQKIQESW
jgi:hypothetical protein